MPSLEITDYEHLATAEIFRAMLALKELDLEINGENLLKMLEDDESARDEVYVLLLGEPRREPDEAIDEVLIKAEKCVAALRGMAIGRRISEISQEVIFAAQTGNLELRNQLSIEQINLERLRRELEKNIALSS